MPFIPRQCRLAQDSAVLPKTLDQGLYQDLSFEERLGLMVDREFTLRDTRGFERRFKAAKLRHDAALENVDFKHPRKLDGALVRSLATGSWIREKRQVLIIGPTGTGKTYLTSALGHAACRQGFTVLYAQMGKLLPDLAVQRGAGRYTQSLKRLSKVDVLLLDDWGLEPLSGLETRILLELLDDRYERSSTLIASQFPTDAWYGLLKTRFWTASCTAPTVSSFRGRACGKLSVKQVSSKDRTDSTSFGSAIRSVSFSFYRDAMYLRLVPDSFA